MGINDTEIGYTEIYLQINFCDAIKMRLILCKRNNLVGVWIYFTNKRQCNDLKVSFV